MKKLVGKLFSIAYHDELCQIGREVKQLTAAAGKRDSNDIESLNQATKDIHEAYGMAKALKVLDLLV